MHASSQELQVQKALQLAQAGHRNEAIRILRGVAAAAPELIPARHLLAMLLHESGASEAALAELDSATALVPANIALQEMRATVLMALGRAAEAETAARTVLATDAGRLQSWLCLGLSLRHQGRAVEAATAARSALSLRPDFLAARRLLVHTLLQQQQADAALQAARHESFFGDSAAALAMADDFLAAGAVQQAVELLQYQARHFPRHYELLLRLSRLLHQQGRSSEALAWSEKARTLRPTELEPQEMHAVSLIDRGEVEAGLEIYRQLLARADVGPELANRHLILSHYTPAQDNEKLFQSHVDWVRRYAQPFGRPFNHGQSLDPQRRLRIGWISPRFNTGPVASFFRSTLAAFDREQFQHTLVSLGAADDAATQNFRDLSDEWLQVRALADEALLERLRAAEFDIVIDLAGHSFGNRLRVLAQRVAPIQLCWLDYFNTTGAPAIDGWISDAWLTPNDSPQRYIESLHRLRCGRFCYAPSQHAPAPQRVGGGAPVFVSFNRLAKLNDRVLDAWSAILHRVPAAQLELGSELLSDAAAHARTIERFAVRGIGSERLRLHGARSYAHLLDAYRHTDIALDPFPFSGCTTTSDALWMGVAVITLPGTTFVSRQSASLLWRMHRDEWVADSISDYIERAVAMAQRVDELRDARVRLREQTRASLCDAAAQAAEMGALLRDLWKTYCSKA